MTLSRPDTRHTGRDEGDRRFHGDLLRENRTLSARNKKLAELLKASRDKLDTLRQQIEDLNQPPSTYGTFLERSEDGEHAEIVALGRQMRVPVSPAVSFGELEAGTLVRLGEGSQVLEACGPSPTGEVAAIKEVLDDRRAVVVDSAGDARVVRLSRAVREAARGPRPGDEVLVEPKAGVAVELLPVTDVAQLSLEEVPEVSYEDIGGLDEQIATIHDAVELPFLHPELFRSYDLKPPKGVLLYGPPGCGKTLIAKAVAHSLASKTLRGDCPCLDTEAAESPRAYFLNIKGPELLNKYVGETERQVRAIFERARELAADGSAVVVFFDEMESLFRTRGSGKSSDVETTVVPQLLTELDGVEQLENVIVIGATNREELIDPALMRPGRLDVKIPVARPDRKAGADIFARYLSGGIPLAGPAAELVDAGVAVLYEKRPVLEVEFVDGSSRAMTADEFVSGAMIASVVDRAKKLAVKDELSGGRPGITAEHVRAAARQEAAENEALAGGEDPSAWLHISGLKGKKVRFVRRIGREGS